MLQKIENAYLAILRVVVILTAGVLLAGVVIYGLKSFQGFYEPKQDPKPPQVSSKELTTQLTAKPSGQDIQTNESETTEESAPRETPGENNQYYARASDVIVNFVAKQSDNQESVIKSKVEEVIRGNAESQSTPELVTAYAKGFAEAIDGTLATPSIAILARQSSATEVVINALSAYNESFHKQLAENEAKYAEEQQKHLEKKADSMMSLYIAAGAFGMFLMVVFLSIFIRIERHLRNLDGVSLMPTNASKQ